MRLKLILLLIMLTISSYGGHRIDTCHCSECMDIKIGQLIIAGFKGTTPSAYIEQALTKYHVAGVIYFDADVSNNMQTRNVTSADQLRTLSDNLQQITPHSPLLVCIDQEGGRVNRLKTRYGFPATVSATRQGIINCADTTHHYAAQTAQTLLNVGINVNFAPCVDLAINPHNPIIALTERAFSSGADTVVDHASIWIYEHQRVGITTSLKHFPGHGSSQTDSHLGLTDITHHYQERELVPYRKLIGRGYDGMVMVGHLVNQNIDTLPASLSANFIDGILRRELGFSGIVITDDMNMGAIVNHYSLDRALCLALNAGVNMIILGNNAKVFEEDLVARSHGYIKQGVEQGRIHAERIDDSYAKVMKLKQKMSSEKK